MPHIDKCMRNNDYLEDVKMKENIVLSGINLFEGGPLSIYYDCLDAIVENGFDKQFNIVAFVHKKELFDKPQYSDIQFIDLPKSRKTYLHRIFYEYYWFFRYSKRREIKIWFSLHDMTPRVRANKVYVYCHSPAPFLKKDISKLKYSWKVVLGSFFYKIFYRINIKKAEAAIVQQDWMRAQFLHLFPVNKVIVARPLMKSYRDFKDNSKGNKAKIFIFPSYPRYFKNFEIVLNACEILDKRGVTNYEVWITIDGSENRYSKELKEKYEKLANVKWLGIQSRDNLFDKYEQANVLIFPSTLETWGLPISEFKNTGKPMLLANLPYSHETVGEYDDVDFFDPLNSNDLANQMEEVIENVKVYKGNKAQIIEEPYAVNWKELLNLMGFIEDNEA